MKSKKVVVIGGGTGAYTVLSGLKKYPLELSAIIGMTDSGGSNRVIRDEFGLLPTSDIRQCMVALASDDSDELLRKLFTYRYSAGVGIEGMTFGNLFMAALTDIYGDQEKAIKKTCEILHVNGNIIPVTFDKVNLVARYENGKQVLGEHEIDEPESDVIGNHIVQLEVVPQGKANPKAIKVIKQADLIIMGPGDLYTSTICNLIIDGVAKEVAKSRAKKIYIVNLMTRFGQTKDFKASDFVNEMAKYLGENVIDYYLINSSKDFPKSVLRRYEEEKAYQVIDDLDGMKLGKAKIVRGRFVSDKVYEKPESDKLVRSLIRHDSEKLAKAIFSLI